MKFKKNQSGMTMVEVLVTMLIVSFGLLGAGALQLMSLQVNQGANQRSQAAILANSVIDSMKGNRTRSLQYARAYGGSAGSESSSNVHEAVMAGIVRQVQSVLPAGDIQVVVAALPATNPAKQFYSVTVSVRWSESGRLLDQQNTSTPPDFTVYQLQTSV